MANHLEYWAFLSYSSRDRVWARWLQRALETYELPRRLVGRETVAGPAPRRLRPVFRDRTELAAQSDLSATLRDALANSAFLIVVCSPHAAASRWVEEEIRSFRAVHGDGRILTAIVAGRAGGEHPDCFPAALGRASTPVGVDLRPGGDGRRLAKLKLIAGILGVGLDELARRDAQRRQGRMAAMTAASLAGAAIMAVLAASAVVSRNEAVRQRAQADRLVGFMLGDLHDRIKNTDRLDLMDGIARQALAYYSAQDPSNLDALSLERRSTAVNLMVEIEIQRGDLDQASRAVAAGAATTAELLARSPNDGQRIFAYAQSVFWVGEVARQRGETDKALASFRQYLDLVQRLPRLDPANNDWRAEVDSAWSDLGTLYLQLGRAREALHAFEQSFAVSQALAAREPGNLDRWMALGESHGWLAETLERLGQVGDARSQRLTELAVYQRILGRDPRYAEAEFATVVGEQAVAELDMIAGDLPAAVRGYGAAASRAMRLQATQSENLNTASVAALAQVRLGEALLAAGRLREARVAESRADAPLAAARARTGAVASWRRYAAEADLLKAALALKSHNAALALGLDQETLDRLGATGPPSVNTFDLWLMEKARLQTGDDLAALGRVTPARAQWMSVTTGLPGAVDRYEPKLLLILVDADKRLGRVAEAAMIRSRLARLSAGRGS